MQDLKFTLMILPPPTPLLTVNWQSISLIHHLYCLRPHPYPLDDPVIMTNLSISFEIKNSIEDEKQMLYEQEWNPLQRRKSCRNPPIPPPPAPTGITRDRPIMISVITVIIYNSNKFDEDDDNNYEGKFS